MLETFSSLVIPPGFEPHGHCFLWDRGLLSLYVVSDSVIALSYYLIPVALVTFVRKRRDLVFNWVFLMFSAFIFACGTTHLIGLWTLWEPVYWIDGSIKAITAGLSVATAVTLGLSFQRLCAFRARANSSASIPSCSARSGTRNGGRKPETQRRAFPPLVEGVHDVAIYMVDPSGKVTTWNRGAERIKGYSADEVIGKHFSCFYTAQDIAAGRPEHLLAEAARQGQREQEHLRVRKDGSTFLAHVLITALYDENGNLYGFAKVVHDVSGRQLQEQKFKSLLKRLRTQS